MQDIQARQYYSMAPMWDRIDPLAEKYYGISPYAYCGGDPVNRGDYDGRDIYSVTQFGIIKTKTESSVSKLVFLDKTNKPINTVQLSDDKSYDDILGTIKDIADKSNYSWGYASATPEKALRIQNVMTENTKSEWKAEVTKDNKGLIITNYENNYIDSYPIEQKYNIKNSDVIIDIHGHPGRNAKDGSESEGTRGGSPGDRNKVKNKPKSKRVFVNHQATGHIYEFDGTHQSINEWNSFEDWIKDVFKYNSMKKYFLCILCTIIVPIQIACREQPKYQDDRMVDTPFQDSILDDLIATSMMNSNRKINPDKQIKYYCITFNYFIENDTTKVWVMGNYNHPFVFHDTQGHDIEKFIGYFKRNNTYCFFYQDIFGNNSHANTIEAIQNITKDWEIRKEPEDPIVFPYEIGYQDPWIFGYYIDGDGHYQLYKEGFF